MARGARPYLRRQDWAVRHRVTPELVGTDRP